MLNPFKIEITHIQLHANCHLGVDLLSRDVCIVGFQDEGEQRFDCGWWVLDFLEQVFFNAYRLEVISLTTFKTTSAAPLEERELRFVRVLYIFNEAEASVVPPTFHRRCLLLKYRN